MTFLEIVNQIARNTLPDDSMKERLHDFVTLSFSSLGLGLGLGLGLESRASQGKILLAGCCLNQSYISQQQRSDRCESLSVAVSH